MLLWLFSFDSIFHFYFLQVAKFIWKKQLLSWVTDKSIQSYFHLNHNLVMLQWCYNKDYCKYNFYTYLSLKKLQHFRGYKIRSFCVMWPFGNKLKKVLKRQASFNERLAPSIISKSLHACDIKILKKTRNILYCSRTHTSILPQLKFAYTFKNAQPHRHIRA